MCNYCVFRILKTLYAIRKCKHLAKKCKTNVLNRVFWMERNDCQYVRVLLGPEEFGRGSHRVYGVYVRWLITTWREDIVMWNDDVRIVRDNRCVMKSVKLSRVYLWGVRWKIKKKNKRKCKKQLLFRDKRHVNRPDVVRLCK